MRVFAPLDLVFPVGGSINVIFPSAYIISVFFYALLCFGMDPGCTENCFLNVVSKC